MATKLFKLAESPGSLNNRLQVMYVYTQFSRMDVTYLDLLQFGHDGSDTYLQDNDIHVPVTLIKEVQNKRKS